MKPQIKYVEHKTHQNDQGEAWIGSVMFSKTGQTVYFNNLALKKLKTGGVAGNYYDLERGDEYWISGIKRNGQDRHWAGGGKIKIDKEIIDEYLSLVEFDFIDKNNFEIVSIPKTDKTKFNRIENRKIEHPIKRKRRKNMKTEQ